MQNTSEFCHNNPGDFPSLWISRGPRNVYMYTQKLTSQTCILLIRSVLLVNFFNLHCNHDFVDSNPILGGGGGVDKILSVTMLHLFETQFQVWLNEIQSFTRYGQVFLVDFEMMSPVTLTLKIASQCFHMTTIWLMVMQYHTKLNADEQKTKEQSSSSLQPPSTLWRHIQ